MTNQIVPMKGIEQVLINGDLSTLDEAQRTTYYMSVCTSLGLNPLTKPFDYIRLNGKLTLYPKKDTTDQLRKIHGVSIVGINSQIIGGVYVVTAHAQTPDGRQETSTGVVSVENKRGDDLANAMMKAETKAKRRVTLSICGLGWLDESELDTIRNVEYPKITDAIPAVIANGASDDAPAEPDPQPERREPATIEEKLISMSDTYKIGVDKISGSLDLSKIVTVDTPITDLCAWFDFYRKWRGESMIPAKAAEAADTDYRQMHAAKQTAFEGV